MPDGLNTLRHTEGFPRYFDFLTLAIILTCATFYSNTSTLESAAEGMNAALRERVAWPQEHVMRQPRDLREGAIHLHIDALFAG